jgi:hypothetical protein
VTFAIQVQYFYLKIILLNVCYMSAFVSSVQVHESPQESTVKNNSAECSTEPLSLPEKKSTSSTALKSPVFLKPSRLSATPSSPPTTQASQEPAMASPQQKTASASFSTKVLSQFGPSSLSKGSPFEQLSVTPAQGQQSTSPSVFSFQPAESSVSQVTAGVFVSSPKTSAQQQSSLFSQQLSKTSHPQQSVASPNTNTSITSHVTLTPIFSHPNSAPSTVFGQQAPMPPAVTSHFSQQTAQPVSLFSGISSTPKTTLSVPPLASSFVSSAAGSKPVSMSDPVGEKPMSSSNALGQKSTVTPSTKASIDPGFSVVQSASSGTTGPKCSGFSFTKATEAAESSFQAKPKETVHFDSDISFASLVSKLDKTGFKTGKNSEFQFQMQVVNIC